MSAPVRHHRFEGYCLDTQLRELRDGAGAVVPLTTKAFDTLYCLVEHRDRLVAKDELLASVWAGRVVEENNLTQAIAALRRVFGTSAGEHRYIVTVPGRGYRFVAEVLEGEADAAAESGQVVADVAAIPGAPVWRRTITLGALLFMLALFAMAAWQMREPSAAMPPLRSQTALAVLPFRSLSSGPSDEGLELGLADTLITRLSHSKALRVRSLASAQRLSGGEQPDVLAAGRQLGAAYVVEGTTQRVGDRVRINARLLSVAKGTTVWADTFDAHIDRVFTLQDAIGTAVTSALAVAPVVLPPRGRSVCDGDDPAAYRALLRAQYQFHRRTPDVIAPFQQAITLDPVCARAYAGLAAAYLFMAHIDHDPGDVFPLAKAAAAQALRIDPDSAAAHMAQGRVQELYAWNWRDSEISLRQAIAFNPSLADAHYSLAHLLVLTGRFGEGLAQIRQARELDPLSPVTNAIEAALLSAAGQPQAAGVSAERTLELEPDFWIALLVRGGLAMDRGDTTAAIADLTRAAAQTHRNSQVLAMLAAAQVAAGERGQAQAILRELQARDAVGYIPASSLAGVYNALGDTNAALDQLERAYREHDIRMAFLKVDARWNNLRTQPRFRTLGQRLGLEAEHATGRL